MFPSIVSCSISERREDSTRNSITPSIPRHDTTSVSCETRLHHSTRKSKSMCWRDIIFTADGMILPPSWPAWTVKDSVRHGHALARARCISEEERVLLELLAQTETHFQVKPRSPTNETKEANSDAASIATTPSTSRSSSVSRQRCVRHDAVPESPVALSFLPPTDYHAALPTETLSCTAVGMLETLTWSTPMPASSAPSGIASEP